MQSNIQTVAFVVVILVSVSLELVGRQPAVATLDDIRMRADQGNADAQAELGFRYANGRGVSRDPVQAMHWYGLAAEQGHVYTQHNLGVMYSDGRGVPQSQTEAARWFRQAAEQGYDRAQYNLGIMYDTGRGVQPDPVEALHWLKLAAEQGHAGGMSYLGAMYGSGKGLSQDYVRAHMWRSLAASRDTTENRQIAIEARDALARRMTATQLAESRYLTREWEAVHPPGP